MAKCILKVENIYKHYNENKQLFKKAKSFGIPAIDDISFELYAGETLGLIGESGSGKTSIGRAIGKLMSVQRGRIELFDQDVTSLSERKFKHLRKDLQIIFQDLDAALNPNMQIKQIMRDIFKLHHPANETQNTINKLLHSVKLDQNVLSKYPSELSGGQKRRIAIANVLASKPKFIIADEPTTGLDQYTQSLILKLIRNLQKENAISMLLISHDLQVIKDNCQRVIVLYLGKIVEVAPVDILSQRPSHPYTQLLWSTFNEGLERKLIKNERSHNVRSGLHDFERPVHGCRFAPRCDQYIANNRPDICTLANNEPPLYQITPNHSVACHFPLNKPKN